MHAAAFRPLRPRASSLPPAQPPLDPRQEDAYWASCFSREPYARCGLDYEDYAPAYCVGYVGCAQYAGRYEDAEPSLCANWARIKGDSRLTLADARCAMRAAWERVAGRAPWPGGEPACGPGTPAAHQSAQQATLRTTELQSAPA